MTDAQKIDMSHLYLVTGRIEDQDDDSALIVEAKSLGEAESKFEADLKAQEAMESDKDEGDITVHIISSKSLETAIAQRLV